MHSFITLHYITLHDVTLHYITVHYITYIPTCIHTCIHLCMCICMYMFTYIHIDIYIYIQLYICTYNISTYLHIYTFTFIYDYIDTNTYIYMLSGPSSAYLFKDFNHVYHKWVLKDMLNLFLSTEIFTLITLQKPFCHRSRSLEVKKDRRQHLNP